MFKTKPECGCTIYLDPPILTTNQVSPDNSLCLYPAAVQAHDDMAKLQTETLRLKRKRTRQLLEAIELMKDMLKHTAWPNEPTYVKVQLFIDLIENKALINADGDVCRCTRPECIAYNKGECGCAYCNKAYATLA